MSAVVAPHPTKRVMLGSPANATLGVMIALRLAEQSTSHPPGWVTAVVVAGAVLVVLMIVVVTWRAEPGGPDDSDGGGGGGGPPPPPPGPVSWPDFERDFADYVAAAERRSHRLMQRR
jgi:hypothetical protein